MVYLRSHKLKVLFFQLYHMYKVLEKNRRIYVCLRQIIHVQCFSCSIKNGLPAFLANTQTNPDHLPTNLGNAFILSSRERVACDEEAPSEII